MIQHCISLSLPFSESGIIGIIALSILMKDQVLLWFKLSVKMYHNKNKQILKLYLATWWQHKL